VFGVQARPAKPATFFQKTQHQTTAGFVDRRNLPEENTQPLTTGQNLGTARLSDTHIFPGQFPVDDDLGSRLPYLLGDVKDTGITSCLSTMQVWGHKHPPGAGEARSFDAFWHV
jgi:hypothetical protein